MNTTFSYGGYHFTPYKKFTDKDGDFLNISRHLKSDPQFGFSTYPNRKHKYSHKSFYKASNNSDCDIFYCKETCKLYVPGLNELFEYKEKI